MKGKQYFFLLLIAFQIASCSWVDNQKVDSATVLEYLSYTSTDTANKSVGQLDLVVFKEIKTKNTAEKNFEEAMAELKLQLTKVDAIQTNEQTALYIKSLVIADFVFAKFGNQFLGAQFESTESERLKLGWNNYTLAKQYELGVQNKVAVDCGMKTAFFKSLVTQMLGVECLDRSIDGVHTFPIIQINNHQYLVDPSNPYVFYDQELGEILAFNQLNAYLKSLIPIQTNRHFGKSRTIISSRFHQKYFKDNIDLKSNLVRFSIQEKELIQELLPTCYELQFEPDIEYYFLNDLRNEVAILINHTSFGTMMSKNSIRRSYLGGKCDANEYCSLKVLKRINV